MFLSILSLLLYIFTKISVSISSFPYALSREVPIGGGGVGRDLTPHQYLRSLNEIGHEKAPSTFHIDGHTSGECPPKEISIIIEK